MWQMIWSSDHYLIRKSRKTNSKYAVFHRWIHPDHHLLLLQWPLTPLIDSCAYLYFCKSFSAYWRVTSGSSAACPNLSSGFIASDYDCLYHVVMLIKIYVHSTHVTENRIMPTGSNFFHIPTKHVSIRNAWFCLMFSAYCSCWSKSLQLIL